MKTLIRLELKKNNINTYILADIIIAITMIGFLFLFAYAPLIEPNDKDMAIFAGYDNLISLFCVFNMAVFCVMSAVMYCRFVIEVSDLFYFFPIRSVEKRLCYPNF